MKVFAIAGYVDDDCNPTAVVIGPEVYSDRDKAEKAIEEIVAVEVDAYKSFYGTFESQTFQKAGEFAREVYITETAGRRHFELITKELEI